MIVVLDEALFHDDSADDATLIAVICEGQGRYKVHTRPAYRQGGNAGVNRWLRDQSLRIQERIRTVLEEGLKAPGYALPSGAIEPRVVIEDRGAPEWPDTFERGPARLPLAVARDLLLRPLHLLLENGRNDWAFLTKVVPSTWKSRWDRAIEKRWIEEQNGGGITEMRRIIEVQLAGDPVRRLRTWAMFDSDGERPAHASTQSEDTRKACKDWGVAHHRLRRRAIENYIPGKTLEDWAWRRRTQKSKRDMAARVRAYCGLTDDERHYHDMKAGFHNDLAQHVWSDAEVDTDGKQITYHVTEDSLVHDGFGSDPAHGKLGEREELFQSLFSRL